MQHSLIYSESNAKYAEIGVNQIIGTFVLFSVLFHGLALILLAPASSHTLQNLQNSKQPQGFQAIIAPQFAEVGNNILPPAVVTSKAKVARPASFNTAQQKTGALGKVGTPNSIDNHAATADFQDIKQGATSPINADILPLTPTAATPYFFTANEVDYRAEMLLPMEMTWFDEEFALSGSLKMNIYVLADGTVEKIDLLSTADVSGALREKLLPLLQMAKYSPAIKNGKPVNSIKTMEFDLAARPDPKTTSETTLAGFRPKLDGKGNIAPNQDLSLWTGNAQKNREEALKKP